MTTAESRLFDYRKIVDLALRQAIPVGHELGAVRAARAALMSPGKRVRPLLTIVVADQLGCPVDRVLPAACAIEMVHAASLILDDLPCMDDAMTRRGAPTLHRIYGEDLALLAVITLVSGAYGIVASAEDIPLDLRVRWSSLLATAIGPLGLVGGQERDLRGTCDRSLDDIRALHLRKTAVLFSAAAEMGAVAAGADAKTLAAASRFGEALGLGLQALDDLADAADISEISRGANLLARLDVAETRMEAEARLSEAGEALGAADVRLANVTPYIDLLLSRMIAA